MFRSINSVLLFGMITLSASVHADYSASAADVMLLPQFCWGQYNSAQFKGPQYHIHDCGPGMNHYCPALISYNHAIGTASRGAREHDLRKALEGVEYTLNWMKKWPACPIRGHVEKTYSRVRIDLGMPPAIEQTQPASIQVPTSPAVESNAVEDSVPKEEGSAGDIGKQEPSSPVEETSKPHQDDESKPAEPEKIGSPTNPWCRFCP